MLCRVLPSVWLQYGYHNVLAYLTVTEHNRYDSLILYLYLESKTYNPILPTSLKQSSWQ